MSIALVLREEPSVEIYRNQRSGNAQQEAAHMQARMDGSRVADAGGEKNNVRQDGECDSRHAGNFRVERVPAPPGGAKGQESESGGSQGHNRRGGDGVAARKTHIGVQQKEQEGDGIFDENDQGYDHAVAQVGLTKQVSSGKENRRHDCVRNRGNHQRDAQEMTGRTGSRDPLSKTS
jgi:hypothetical protein